MVGPPVVGGGNRPVDRRRWACMDPASSILFCRCWCGFTPEAPLSELDGYLDDAAAEEKLRELALEAADDNPDRLTRFVEAHKEADRQRRAAQRRRSLGQPTAPTSINRRRASASTPRSASELSLAGLRDDLPRLLEALGWRAPRGRTGAVVVAHDGKVFDPLWLPAFLVLEVSSQAVACDVVAALNHALPASIEGVSPHSATAVTARIGALTTSDLSAPRRAELSIQLRQLGESIHTPSPSSLPNLRVSRHAGIAALHETMVVHARLLADELDRDDRVTGASAVDSLDADVHGVVLNCNEFRQEGSGWRITFNCEHAIFPDLKGLHHLQELIRRQGQPVHVLDLSPDLAGGTAPDPHLDQRAKDEFEAKLIELREQRQQAVESQNALIIQECDAESAEIKEALRKGCALRGRDRMTGDREEGARRRTSSAIRTALARLKEGLPDLHAHFEEHLDTPTGLTPKYLPPEGTRWLL